MRITVVGAAIIIVSAVVVLLALRTLADKREPHPEQRSNG